MTLEDSMLLKMKNEKRLKYVYMSSLVMGINLKSPTSSKDLLKLISIILLIASCTDVYGQICFILRYKHSIVMMAEGICTLLQTLISILKLGYLLFVQHKFYLIMKLISTHELVDGIEFLAEVTPYNRILRIEARRILDKCWNIALGQFNFYKTACVAIISYYVINSQIINGYNWYIGNNNHTIMMPFPALYPFFEHKMDKMPEYMIFTFVGICANYMAGIGAICFDGLFIIIALHCVALIRILRLIIVFTTSSSVPKHLRLNYICQCINHYERTFEFYKDFNNLYLHMSLVQFLFSLVTHGVVMFQGSVGLGNDVMMVIRMIMFMAASGFEVVIYCLNGQFLSSESENLIYTWFECKWYNESKEFKQFIKMMIMRSNRTFEMKASWFSTMSLTTLISLVQTSGSYFLLLRNLAVQEPKIT